MGVSDGEWEQSHGRAASKIAKSFSLAMEDAFRVDLDPLTELSLSVARKQEAISSQQSELQQLEARIREAESKLRERRSRLSTPARSLNSHPTDSPGSPRPGLHDVFTPPSSVDGSQHNGGARHGGWTLLPSPSPPRDTNTPPTSSPLSPTSSYSRIVRDSSGPPLPGSSYNSASPEVIVDRRKLPIGARAFVRRKKSGALDL